MILKRDTEEPRELQDKIEEISQNIEQNDKDMEKVNNHGNVQKSGRLTFV